MADVFGRDDGALESVDLSGVPRRSGLTLYASTKLEESAKGNWKGQVYGNATYNPPAGMPAAKAIELHSQIHQEVLRLSTARMLERKVALEQGNDVAVEQFDVDLISGEILE
jgi:hypothetical protein